MKSERLFLKIAVLIAIVCFLVCGHGQSQIVVSPVHKEMREWLRDWGLRSFLREPLSVVWRKDSPFAQRCRVKIEEQEGKTILTVYKGEERKLALKGKLFRGTLLNDNEGHPWLYFIASMGGPVDFFLVPLDTCQGEVIDLSRWKEAKHLRVVFWVRRPWGLRLEKGSPLNVLFIYDGKAFRIERVHDRLWLWTVNNSGYVVLSWEDLEKLNLPRIEIWNGVLLNPNKEFLGILTSGGIPYVEKVLRALRPTKVTSQDLQRFERLPHGPEKWSLGVKLALYGGEEAGKALIRAFQQPPQPAVLGLQRWEDKVAEGGLQAAFRAMLIELIGLSADRCPQAREFLRNGLDPQTWKRERWKEGWGVDYSWSGIGLSDVKELWDAALKKRQWIEKSSPEALQYGRKFGDNIVMAAFYRWVIQQVGKERFVREIWFQRPLGEWWERWEKTPEGQDWIHWYAQVRAKAQRN